MRAQMVARTEFDKHDECRHINEVVSKAKAIEGPPGIWLEAPPGLDLVPPGLENFQGFPIRRDAVPNGLPSAQKSEAFAQDLEEGRALLSLQAASLRLKQTFRCDAAP